MAGESHKETSGRGRYLTPSTVQSQSALTSDLRRRNVAKHLCCIHDSRKYCKIKNERPKQRDCCSILGCFFLKDYLGLLLYTCCISEVLFGGFSFLFCATHTCILTKNYTLLLSMKATRRHYDAWK